MPRAWRASEVYRALRTAEARHVAELVLFDRPRFRDETCWFGGKPFIVRRGQLFDAEETIAELAGTSRKVVRTVLRILVTAGHITRERVHPSGQCPHVITVLDYELSQTLPTNGANGTAKEGPEAGQRRAPSEPQEPQEPQEPEAPAASASASLPLSPVVLSLPCVGNGPAQFEITQDQVAKWKEAFPGLDVLEQLRRAGAWLDANPTKRKTHRGMAAFLVRWLSRAQDQGGRQQASPGRARGMAPPSTDFTSPEACSLGWPEKRARGMAPPSTEWPAETREVKL